MITNAHLCAQGFKAEGEAMLSVCVFFAKASVTLLFFLFSISTPFPVQVSPFWHFHFPWRLSVAFRAGSLN